MGDRAVGQGVVFLRRNPRRNMTFPTETPIPELIPQTSVTTTGEVVTTDEQRYNTLSMALLVNHPDYQVTARDWASGPRPPKPTGPELSWLRTVDETKPFGAKFMYTTQFNAIFRDQCIHEHYDVIAARLVRGTEVTTDELTWARANMPPAGRRCAPILKRGV